MTVPKTVQSTGEQHEYGGYATGIQYDDDDLGDESTEYSPTDLPPTRWMGPWPPETNYRDPEDTSVAQEATVNVDSPSTNTDPSDTYMPDVTYTYRRFR